MDEPGSLRYSKSVEFLQLHGEKIRVTHHLIYRCYCCSLPDSKYLNWCLLLPGYVS